jgi:hypothetical protein
LGIAGRIVKQGNAIGACSNERAVTKGKSKARPKSLSSFAAPFAAPDLTRQHLRSTTEEAGNRHGKRFVKADGWLELSEFLVRINACTAMPLLLDR